MKYLLIILSSFALIGCSSLQLADKYYEIETVRHYHEGGCYVMQVNFDKEQSYVGECFERTFHQGYVTGLTLGIISLSAADYKFEDALLDYLKENHKLINCKITRSDADEIMGDTLGVEIYYECDNKPENEDE
tara:strand:+ start:1260 stop:1658 length:399 start_codon:yes stop_codon:yes gene_type:complete